MSRFIAASASRVSPAAQARAPAIAEKGRHAQPLESRLVAITRIFYCDMRESGPVRCRREKANFACRDELHVMTQPEVWLRGPLPDYIDELQPVAHSLLQVREEIEAVVALPQAQLWATARRGRVDRFPSEASGRQPRSAADVRDGQAVERRATRGAGRRGAERRSGRTADTLVRAAQSAIDRALNQIRTTPLCTLDEAREVGRDRLPSTVLGLLFHAAEHAQRHSAQIITTAKII